MVQHRTAGTMARPVRRRRDYSRRVPANITLLPTTSQSKLNPLCGYYLSISIQQLNDIYLSCCLGAIESANSLFNLDIQNIDIIFISPPSTSSG